MDMGDEEVPQIQQNPNEVLVNKKGFFSKITYEGLVKGVIILALILMLGTFFLEWTNNMNLFQANLILGIVFSLIIILTGFYFYKDDFNGGIGLLLVSVTFLIFEKIISRFRGGITVSFQRFIVMFIGNKRIMRDDGIFLFGILCIILLVFLIIFISIKTFKMRRAGILVGRKLIYSIVFILLILAIIFGSLFVHYQIVKARSNAIGLEYFECHKNFLEDHPGYSWINVTTNARECVNIIPQAENIYPDVFWEVDPLLCLGDGENYESCIDYVLGEWDKGNKLTYDDINAKAKEEGWGS
jgi:hypothetical protein